ncbi:hypothetical protein J1N09_10295 [Aureitalea sp. L0-47]|uniref:hypothetical protein n=1 Tax=Aureitalea sp. L0-47 TaxID=2816962 RepID=UPI002237A45F|nr:hypothetical protein [Aureitalea sp. L0-47]MCW5520229.1 hypothetical protein [Aureitalea sp. L0-47]
MNKIFFLLCFLFSANLSYSSGHLLNKIKDNHALIGNEDLNVSVKTAKDIYNELEEITVVFSGFPGGENDWITLINPSSAARDYGNWKYTKGVTDGTLTFKGLQVGDYEVRAFFGTDFTIQARYPFKVIKSTNLESQQGTIDRSPAKNFLYSLIERLDKLEDLKNSPDWGSEEIMLQYSGFLETAPIHLRNVKTYDPNFDVSDLQTRLDGYQTYYDNNLGTVNDYNLAKAEFEKLILSKSWQLSNLLDDKLGSGAEWVHSYYNTSNYLKAATEIDYPNLLKITTEGDAKFKGHNLDSKVQTVKAFERNYAAYYNETLQVVINGLIEGAFENKTGNEREAIKYIEQAKQLSEAAILILPEDSNVNSLHKQMMTAYESLTENIYKNIFTSDFHKNNIGKVVFFSKRPKIKSENISTVKDLYKAGDFIYAMAYLEGSFKDLASARNAIKVTTSIYVDGTEKTSHEFSMSWESLKENKTYLYMEIIPDPATNTHSGPAKFSKTLANISPRNHEIKVTLTGLGIGLSNIIPFAEGTFTLDCSTGRDQLANYAIKYREKNLAGVYMPGAKMNNPDLTQSMKQALINEGWEDNKKVQRIVITDNNWKIYKHTITGKTIYRTIPAAVAFKTSEGECKYWNLTFKQVYNGTSYENTIVGGVGSIEDLSCNNVNKQI